MPCPHCKDTGFRNITFMSDGKEYTGVKRCECKTKSDAARPGGFADIGSFAHPLIGSLKKSENQEMGQSENRPQPSDAEIDGGMGIEYAAARAAQLPKPDCEIAAIILNHRGKSNPVSIEEICKMLWLQEWNGASLDATADGWVDHLRRSRTNLIRSVKASVERIRNQTRIPIASWKGEPGGYFVPETAEEADEYAHRIFGEAVKMMQTAQLFSPKTDWVQEMRGQLQLR